MSSVNNWFAKGQWKDEAGMPPLMLGFMVDAGEQERSGVRLLVSHFSSDEHGISVAFTLQGLPDVPQTPRAATGELRHLQCLQERGPKLSGCKREV